MNNPVEDFKMIIGFTVVLILMYTLVIAFRKNTVEPAPLPRFRIKHDETMIHVFPNSERNVFKKHVTLTPDQFERFSLWWKNSSDKSALAENNIDTLLYDIPPHDRQLLFFGISDADFNKLNGNMVEL